jgi:hypothetical protein
MTLEQIFGGSPELAELVREAGALDDAARFRALTANVPLGARAGALERAVRECSGAFGERAGLADAPPPRWRAAPVFGAQQPYVDYYPAVLAKLDALECAHPSFYAFADYAPLGSYPWLARAQIPSVTAPDGLLHLHIHRANGAERGKDLRFVSLPPPAAFDDVRVKLVTAIKRTARALSHDQRGSAADGSAGFTNGGARFSEHEAFARLRSVLVHQREARTRALNAAEFNAIWSARTFRELGFTVPLLPLSELLEHDALLPSVAETLSVFVRHSALVSEAIDEVLALDAHGAIPFARKGAGHVPVALAGARDGIRRPLRAHRRGADWWLVSGRDAVRSDEDAPGGEAFNVGPADAPALEELLRSLRGRWSPDVFVPIFLFRLGAAGLVSGRGSVRYSLVVAHVMRRLFGEPHPPNLLCSCAPAQTGPFVEALHAERGEVPPAVRATEPALIARLLHSAPETIREEIAASWRDPTPR